MDAPAMALIIVLMMHMAVAVGARLGLKTNADFMHMATKPLDHRLQYMVGQQAHEAVADLDRNMPVADVIRDAGEFDRIVGMNLEQALGGSLDRHDAPVCQQQPVAVAQQRARRQIDTDLLARQQRGPKPRSLALLESQLDHLVDRPTGRCH